jgi:hypothetical protein
VRSGNPDIYRPPGGRTEQDVAAEVIVRLLEAKVINPTPANLRAAAMAVGVPVPLIRETWALVKARRSPLDKKPVTDGPTLVPMPPPEPEPEAQPEAPVPAHSPKYATGARKYNEAKRAAKEPMPGKRICAHCNELKPKSQFATKNKRTRQLSAWCKPCIRDYQKARYLSSERLKKLGLVLRFVLGPEDEHAGMLCAGCHQPCRIRDEVLASDAILRHGSCGES